MNTIMTPDGNRDEQKAREDLQATHFVPSENCYNLIKQFEGLELGAYLCPAKIWTIGYGSTFYEDGKPVKKGDVITKERAEALLPKIVLKFAIEVYQRVKVDINQNQFDSLVSFTYNLGIGNFASSTLLKKLNKSEDKAVVAAEFHKWNKAKGKVLQGLVNRRKAEAELFLS